MIEIQIVYPYSYYRVYYLFSENTILVYCTLLNNSYLGTCIYLQKTITQKTGKKKKEGQKEFGGVRTRDHRLDPTTPNHYTKETDYVNQGKDFNLMPFP